MKAQLPLRLGISLTVRTGILWRRLQPVGVGGAKSRVLVTNPHRLKPVLLNTMNFLENIFSRLQEAAGRVVLAEASAGGDRTATGSDLLGQIAAARAFLRASGLAKGDRCALVAPNSIRWAALDLAIIAEGLIAVPMYARQAAGELAAMLRDAGPGLDLLRRRGASRCDLGGVAGCAALRIVRRNFQRQSAVRNERASLARRPFAAGYGRHSVHVGNFRRSQRRDAHGWQSRSHAFLHQGAPRSIDGAAQCAGPRLPLPAVLFRRVVDSVAVVPVADERPHDVDGSYETCRGNRRRGARIIF